MRTGCLMISAAGSGHGKSVFTMGLLQALKLRGVSLMGFKCGPDYIDPEFHTRVLQIPCRSLDTWLMGEAQVLREIEEAGKSAQLLVCEGAMGLYDGLGTGRAHSAYSIAHLCEMSVVVILDAAGRISCEDQLKSLLKKDTGRLIRGVFVNRCGEEDASGLVRRIEHILDEHNLPDAARAREVTGRVSFCGCLPVMEEAEFPSRHLGLVRAQEAGDFLRRVAGIAAVMERAGIVDAALNMAGGRKAGKGSLDTRTGGGKLESPEESGTGPGRRINCRIAVARDEAFSFLYQSCLDHLEHAGAQLCFFSPVRDSALPEGTDGLYLPGGYPELYASALEKNVSMRRAVRSAVMAGLPTVAECGGFLYLGEWLQGEDTHMYRMAGALPGSAVRKDSLVRFGYLELTQDRGNSLLFREGETVRAHEFHYWDSDCCGEDLLALKRTKGKTWRCGVTGPALYAAFPHLYLDAVHAERFVQACKREAQHPRRIPQT